MKFSDDQMQQLSDLLDSKLEQKLEEKLEQKLDPIRKDIRIIKRDAKTTVNFLDERHQELASRVDRIETVLHLTKMS